MTEDTKNKQSILTEPEEEFCQLFVCGGAEYAGQRDKCFKEVFGEQTAESISLCSRRLTAKPHVAARIRELGEMLQCENENIAVKIQVAETLKAIMEETSTAQFSDKFGITLSPAPLRAVAVNAAKALMDLYPIRHEQEAKLRIEGSDGKVIFNVVIPQIPQVENETGHNEM